MDRREVGVDLRQVLARTPEHPRCTRYRARSHSCGLALLIASAPVLPSGLRPSSSIRVHEATSPARPVLPCPFLTVLASSPR